jgi:hypothetical protein
MSSVAIRATSLEVLPVSRKSGSVLSSALLKHPLQTVTPDPRAKGVCVKALIVSFLILDWGLNFGGCSAFQDRSTP